MQVMQTRMKYELRQRIRRHEEQQTHLGRNGRHFFSHEANQQNCKDRNAEKAGNQLDIRIKSTLEKHNERRNTDSHQRHTYLEYLPGSYEFSFVRQLTGRFFPGAVQVHDKQRSRAVQTSVESTQRSPKNNGSNKSGHDRRHDVPHQSWEYSHSIIHPGIQMNSDQTGNIE